MDSSMMFAFVVGVLMLSVMKEGQAVHLSSTVTPSEARRQGINQQDPCAGDTIDFVCILNGSSTTLVEWIVDGTSIYIFPVPRDLGVMRDNVRGVNATLVNRTLFTLQIRLPELLVDSPVMNGSVIECQETGDVTTSQNETLNIIGPASPPSVSVRRNSLSRLIIDVTTPADGRECVDSYRATAVVGGVTLTPMEQQVSDPTQEVYTLEFQGVDLCRDTLTSVTAFGVTDGVEGAMATPGTDDDIDRTMIINSAVLSSQVFIVSSVKFLLSWQVVDDRIQPNGFQVTCFIEDNPINCDVQGNDLAQRAVEIPVNNNLIGANFTSSVNYSFEMCSDFVSASLRVASLVTSGPVVVTGDRAIVVTFNQAVLDSSASRVNFSSNCTTSITEEYMTNLRITIPEARQGIQSDGSLCQYTIQLVDASSRHVGPPINGSFNITGLPSSSPGTNAAAIGGGVGGVVGVLLLAIIVGVILYIVYNNKGTAVDKGDGGEDSTDAKLDLATYADPNSIEHEQAPSGEEYAMVATRPAKNKPEVSAPLYQDPNTIQHEEAAGGDLYTVVDKPKKGSKKTTEPSEDQLAQMYSVPDKSRKNQDKLNYADIDLPRGGPAPSQHQTEYSSLVN